MKIIYFILQGFPKHVTLVDSNNSSNPGSNFQILIYFRVLIHESTFEIC